MALLSYASRINIAFFWLFVILGGAGLVIMTMLSNTWQEIAQNPEFSTTITRFPITDALLGTYGPTLATAVVLLVLIFTFGKPKEGS